jgi:long-chain acyl-CoA synthetase
LRASVENFSRGLAAIGVKRGDHIAIISENRPEWVVADLGMIRLGAVNISIFPTLTPKQIEFILNDAGVKYAIVSNQLQLGKVLSILPATPAIRKIILLAEDAPPEDGHVIAYSRLMAMGIDHARGDPAPAREEEVPAKPDDLLTIIYTSGTTGNPKGVMLTHRNLVSNIKSSAECILFTEGDILLSYLPLSHSYERMAGYYTAMACGATIAYAENVDTIRENLMEVRPTVITTVPRLIERLYSRLLAQVELQSTLRRRLFRWAIDSGTRYGAARKEGRSALGLTLQRAAADRLVFRNIRERMGGRMRFFVSGAAALPRELGEFFETVGVQIIEGYGMTESSPVISVNRLDDYKFGTVGKPIPGVEVMIAQDGEILVRGPNVMKGYWQNERASCEAVDPAGWLHTGDIGRIDGDGFLTITDRKKHLFVTSGGKNIAPQPIENLFLQSRLISQFVLIGDGRMFLSALIVPDFAEIKGYARSMNIGFKNGEELSQTPEIRLVFENEIKRIQKDLANYERVRKFTILSEPLTIENGEVTPTLKVRRKIVEEKFKPVIDRMYQGLG